MVTTPLKFLIHMQEICGNSFSQGTCVLLELSSLNYLVHYFQSIHYNALFELKGVQVNDDIIQTNNIQTENCFDQYTTFNQSYTVAMYSLCYSLMKQCGYWNANTLSTIVNNGNELCVNMNLNKYVAADQLPKTVNVCGAQVALTLCSNTSNGVLLNTYTKVKTHSENLV